MAANQTTTKVIFDTDVGKSCYETYYFPHLMINMGGDDMMGLLFAMSALPAAMEVLLITTVFGNVNVEKGLRNVVSMFYVLWLELGWRRDHGKTLGFGAFQAHRPLVSLGSAHALGEPVVVKGAGGHHGIDGLHNFHELYPQFSPDDSWQSLFNDSIAPPENEPEYYRYFNTTREPAHKAIIRLLRENPPSTISLVAVGPMTNIALAATEDPITFLRAKERLVVGGAVHVPRNVSPVSEANTANDAVAAARSYALSSQNTSSIMPPGNCRIPLGPYPEHINSTIPITMFPLDITLSHCVQYDRFAAGIKEQLDSGSPLAALVYSFVHGIHIDSEEDCVILHDPLTIWYALTRHERNSTWEIDEPRDIRVETTGQWTKGMNVGDGREYANAASMNLTEIPDGRDPQGWRSAVRGNRIRKADRSPGPEAFHQRVMSLFDL